MNEHKRSLEEVRREREMERLVRLGYAGKYRKSNREKLQARRAVFIALRAGRLHRKPCDVCSAIQVEAHHPDYKKPLDVRWLCKRHHELAHHALTPAGEQDDEVGL